MWQSIQRFLLVILFLHSIQSSFKSEATAKLVANRLEDVASVVTTDGNSVEENESTDPEIQNLGQNPAGSLIVYAKAKNGKIYRLDVPQWIIKHPEFYKKFVVPLRKLTHSTDKKHSYESHRNRFAILNSQIFLLFL